MLARPTVLGPYTIQRSVRDCQVGATYLATQPRGEGFQKRLIVHCAPRDRIEHVVTEANRAARLSHAGVAHMLDAGAHEDVCYVAFEHSPGTTLHGLIQRHGSLPWGSLARLVADAALALAYAHGRRDEDGRLLGIVHGRMSPRRVAIDASGHAQVTGLGASWAWPDHQGFGAPEEGRGEPVDGRADVFALGAILRRYTQDATAPRDIARIIEQATQPWPEHRYTASDLHAALSAALREDGTVPGPRDIAALAAHPTD